MGGGTRRDFVVQLRRSIGNEVVVIEPRGPTLADKPFQVRKGERSGIDAPEGLAAVGAWTFSASFAILWTLKKLWGIRVEEEAETSGLDVSEHGMWGYPEFYIPVPGGYGTEAHAHVSNNVGPPSRTAVEPALGSTS